MQETLYDGDGNPIAYIDYNDSSTFYMWDGQPVAYLDDANRIYGFNGMHLGWYENGIVRNLRGEKNGFNKNTLTVYRKFEPFKSFKRFKPFKRYKEYPKYKPYTSFRNSPVSLSQYLLMGKI